MHVAEIAVGNDLERGVALGLRGFQRQPAGFQRPAIFAEIPQIRCQVATDPAEAATVAVAGQVPLGALGTKLRSIQEDARRQFATVTESLVAAQERIVRQGGG